MEKTEKMETINENNELKNFSEIERIKLKPKEPIAEVMGDFGKWQMQKITIVFLIGIPGIAHIFSAAFVAAKTDFWCKDNLLDNRSNYTIDTLPVGTPTNKNSCDIGCQEFGFDQSFWSSTIIMQYNLVCQWSYLSGKIKSRIYMNIILSSKASWYKKLSFKI